MKNTPIKKIRLLTASLLLGVSLLFSGCSAFQLFGERAPELPDNAQSFKKVDSERLTESLATALWANAWVTSITIRMTGSILSVRSRTVIIW